MDNIDPKHNAARFVISLCHDVLEQCAGQIFFRNRNQVLAAVAMCELWLELFPSSGRTSSSAVLHPPKKIMFSALTVPGWNADLSAPKVPSKLEPRNLLSISTPEPPFETRRLAAPATRRKRPCLSRSTRPLQNGSIGIERVTPVIVKDSKDWPGSR